VRPILIIGIGAAVAIGVVVAIVASLSANSAVDTGSGAQAGGNDPVTATEMQVPGQKDEENEGNSVPESGGEPPSDAVAPSSPAQPADQDAAVYQVYTEPTERAFTILIPVGWKAESQVSVPLGALTVGFAAQSPDLSAGIQFENPRQMRYSYPADGREGVVTYGGFMTQYFYRTADQYVADILIPEYRQSLSPDLQLVRQTILASYPGVSAGFFEFSFSRDGIPYTTQAYISTAGTVLPSGEVSEWSVNISAVAATTDQFDEFAETGWNLLGTKTANPDFVMRYISNAGSSSDALSDSYNESFFSALHSIQQSQSGLDATFQGLSEATLGVHQETDASGNTYTVTNEYDSWYVGSSTGNLYGSNTAEPPQTDENVVALQQSG
jgi:hypothetical protein